tara:strand:- start:357 stop:581 length:225 start_codon:yes stop_codon:yes gene_type:complete
MSQFEIEVTVTHTRTYTVEAKDGHDALAKYQADEAEFDNDDMQILGSWVEDGDTAEVYTTDGLRTLVATADGDV